MLRAEEEADQQATLPCSQILQFCCGGEDETPYGAVDPRAKEARNDSRLAPFANILCLDPINSTPYQRRDPSTTTAITHDTGVDEVGVGGIEKVLEPVDQAGGKRKLPHGYRITLCARLGFR